LTTHAVSETLFGVEGQGVHTAFLDFVELLRESSDVRVVVNGEGTGDIYHAHTYGPYYFWKGRHYQGRRVYTVHVVPDSIEGSLPFASYLRPFVEWYFRIVWSYADVCVAISPAVAEAVRRSGADTEIVEIYNPVSVGRYTPSDDLRSQGRDLLGIDQEAFVVLGVGQLQPRKGVDTFLDVAAQCPDLTFVWVGGRPFRAMTEGIRHINQRIRESGSHVHFAGLVDFEDMPKVYNAADLFLFPSHQENCPMAPLEAAAADLPVIFRDIPEYELLYDVPYLRASDTETFRRMTRRMATDEDFRDQGRAVSEELVQQFDREAVREQLVALYRRLVG
jgi:1,2-diacylglycerol-3-alpha-glucose alpha-1,2-galactosyltransferase